LADQIPPERALTRTPEPAPASDQPQQRHRPSSFPYLDESMAGGGRSVNDEDPSMNVDPEPQPIRGGALAYGPYKGVPIEQVPTEHLEWQVTAFENGPEPIVTRELRRRERESNKPDAQHD
jgi:hypothetical protein